MRVMIGERAVGRDESVYVIAEAGVNHNGDPALAVELLERAAAAGADAVKFQTFKPELLATAAAGTAEYQRRGGASAQREMLTGLTLPIDSWRLLAERARSLGVDFLSTPFDQDSVELLTALGVAAYKLSSGDLTDLPLVQAVAARGLPVILSTGMATMAEVEQAVQWTEAAGNTDYILLQCTSLYPAAAETANLRCIETMRQQFLCPVGYSDHTDGIDVAIAAVATGADVLEKHLTLDRSLPGPDHRASLDPDQFTRLVRSIRRVERALGDGRKRPTTDELTMQAVARRSLVANRYIKQGALITDEMITTKRPGTGIPPRYRDLVVGRKAVRDIPADRTITWDMV